MSARTLSAIVVGAIFVLVIARQFGAQALASERTLMDALPTEVQTSLAVPPHAYVRVKHAHERR